MRIILAGQKSFGLAAYHALQADGHDICAVWSPTGVTMNDKLTRRSFHDGVWAHPGLRGELQVKTLEADLVVAAHSHDFIPRASRAATRLGGIGYHPSLLPRHRGRDAVRWTVHVQDPIAGGSVYWLTDNVDGGPVAAQDWCFAPLTSWHSDEERASALWREQLFPMGIRLLRQVLDDLERHVIVEIPQDERYATWEPSWERPPLFRPDLPQIGGINGYTHVTAKSV